MDSICQEIGIPKKQIKETKKSDRFIAIVNKSWLKCLVQQKRIAKFPIHDGFDEWPASENSLGHAWTLTYITAYKKYTHKVIPLPNYRKDNSYETNESLLSLSQLMQHVSQANHRNLWKSAYNKYSGQRAKLLTKETINKNEKNAINLVPYDTVLLEAITRTYGSNCVIPLKTDKIKPVDEQRQDKKKSSLLSESGRFEAHVNLYPITSVIESNTHFYVIYGRYIENNLYDCVTYSPAVIYHSYNKPLFMIYQLLQLMKTLHDRGILLGNIGLDDIFLTNTLWLQIIPQIDLNILQSVESFAETSANSFAARKSSGLSIKLPTADHLSYSLKDYCEMWCNGQISNFDYLTILNNLSGRRIGEPRFHHIMPWVTDFISRNGMNWRDLTKSKYRLNKGDTQLDLMFVPPASAGNVTPHHVSDVLSEITYYVYMARRTPKSILCKHVRPVWVPAEYPATISRLYDWTPDECIPEFFTDPLVFKSIHEDLPDLEVPTWSSCPEDFITRHREALESQYVSERLCFWIDLNFGYKLTGNAAIKAKNVHLSLADNHQTLRKHGMVQLFTEPHPPKLYQTAWTSKTPPRIYSQTEARRRMTRSTDDLSNKYLLEMEMLRQNQSDSASPSLVPKRSTSKNRTHSPNIPDDALAGNIERSMSLHSNVQRTQNQIILPKDYNPVAALNAVENMEVFLSKTFYNNLNNANCPQNTIDYTPAQATCTTEEGVNAFTNRIFSENFEASLMKDTKRLHNLTHKNLYVQNSTRNYKEIITAYRCRELQVLACIIVEIFLANKFRSLGTGTSNAAKQTFEERVEACKSVLKTDFHLLPKCVQYPVKLLFSFKDDSNPMITEFGLPKPTPHQILQPFLSNFLFPFPEGYFKVYALLKALDNYEITNNLLDTYTYFDCDGSNCKSYDLLDKIRVSYKRKIAECKVSYCVLQIDGLLIPHGYEQYNLVDLVLPHIIDLLTNDETSILTAWHLFDSVAIALGPKGTEKHLLQPILRLYDADSDDRSSFLSIDSNIKFPTSSAFKSRKTIKLYHHSFLLRLIVRFGLKCFLKNFIAPLIEATGGYKEPNYTAKYHYHDSIENSYCAPRTNKIVKIYVEDNSSTLRSENDELFAFEGEADEMQKSQRQNNLTDSCGNDTDAINKIMDQFEMSMTGESMLDLRFSHSNALEVTEDTTLLDRDENNSGLSFDENRFGDDNQSTPSVTGPHFEGTGPTSPTIPIPAPSKRLQFDSIDCEIGSKQSNESDYLTGERITQKRDLDQQPVVHSAVSASKQSESLRQQMNQQQYKISQMSAESLIWLSHRLGPVLTARYLTRNLLKMLTLCYVGQENLLPDFTSNNDENENLAHFSIAEGRVIGDKNSCRVLECLTSIAAIFGDHFILLQYLPHITELIVLCKKRITSNLEGVLISSLQLLKHLVPCLSDTTIMDQLHDVILKNIIHPIIRLIGSSRCVMPSGFLARSVLARKLLDVIYVLAVRIGPEMTKEHLCVPALQRFFLIFDKAYGISDNLNNEANDDLRNSFSSDDSNLIETYRETSSKEGSTSQLKQSRTKSDNAIYNISPPNQISEMEKLHSTTREKALEEISDVFTPHLAHDAYVPFLKYLGDHIMKQFVKNLSLILNLCHEFEQPDYTSSGTKGKFEFSLTGRTVHTNQDIPDCSIYSNSFGTPVVGNRIEVHKDGEKAEIGPMEVLDLVAHKFEQVNTARHLRGNWLAYWEHEIGRPEKNDHFNFKQIKLQTFAGHTNSVRSLLCLDNENSFMSASKDKTVKLWSLRSEGDGSKVSSCQFTYISHRKSVHSLAFLESLRLTVSCDSGVHIWDPFVGGEIGQLDSHRLTPVSIVKTYPAPSPLILAGTAESTLKTIDARTFSYVNEWKFGNSSNGSVRCIAVAPSGNWIAIGLSSGQLILCDGRTGVLIAIWKATEGELLQLIAINDHQVISSSLDHSISVWSTLDGSLLHCMKNPGEPAHCLVSIQDELLFGTPANRIGVYPSIAPDVTYSMMKLRSETFKGVLTSLALLPLNRQLLVGGDSGNISLLC